MKFYTFLYLVLAIVFISGCVGEKSTTKITPFAIKTVECEFSWPQKVIIDSVSYTCSYTRPYCYAPGVSEGMSQCCKWSEASGYSDCESIGTGPCTPSPCPSGYTCESDGVCRKNGKTCTETGDSGKDYSKKGTVTDTQTPWGVYTGTDTCDGNKVIELFCKDNDEASFEFYTCPYGCENGACKSEPLCTPSPCPSGYTCESDGVCRKNGKTCTDDDSGKDYSKKGTLIDTQPQTNWVGNTWTDICEGNKLTEFYCDSDDNVQLEYKYCSYICENGACKSAVLCDPVCPSDYICESDGVCRKNGKTCTETGDSGKDYSKKGTVTDTQTKWVGRTWTDVCEGNELTEFYCEYDNVNLESKDCSYGCENGVCKNATAEPTEEEEEITTATCVDSDGEKGYSTKTTVTSPSGSSTDKCEKDYTDWPFTNYAREDLESDEYLVEFYCNQWTNQINAWFYDCKAENKICKDGACTEGPCPLGYTLESDGICRKDGKTCTETGDSGPDIYKQGTVTDIQPPTSWKGSTWTDACEGNELTEFYCSNDDVTLKKHPCACENGVCKSTPIICYDSDGEDIYNKGTVTDSDSNLTDWCSNDGVYLIEYLCDQYGESEFHAYQCEHGCIDGTCRLCPECPEGFECESDGVCRKDGKTCYDSDGEDFYKKGTIIDTADEPIFIQTEWCTNDKKFIIEYVCDPNRGAEFHPYECEYGCRDGACRTGYECSGSARLCNSYNAQDCASHPGCWVLFWLWCMGDPASCSSYSSESSCEAQGCTWS